MTEERWRDIATALNKKAQEGRYDPFRAAINDLRNSKGADGPDAKMLVSKSSA